MKRLIRAAAMVLLVLAVTLAIAADKAKSLYTKGKDAEARQNYEQAYDDYKQAYDLKPGDLTYRAAFERLRFLAGASHVHRGQLLREAGQLGLRDKRLGSLLTLALVKAGQRLLFEQAKT